MTWRGEAGQESGRVVRNASLGSPGKLKRHGRGGQFRRVFQKLRALAGAQGGAEPEQAQSAAGDYCYDESYDHSGWSLLMAFRCLYVGRRGRELEGAVPSWRQ